ncbi:MAG: chemotaxis protein CheR, partial [Spirochaetota bacterium]|nr:chemotaxis protein CheR [Spirochaetota bacterium]
MFQISNLQEFSDQEFQEFCQYIYDNVGIKLTDKKRSLVHNRLRNRLVQLKLTTYGDYLRFVKKSPNGKDELVHLINAITTNVTTFFRDPKQFQTFSQLVLPFFENAKRKIRIWSAGCSTGEEPYSIAIEILKYTTGFNFEIIAKDI